MGNACGFYCCGSDEFDGCGCDQCPCSDCWPGEDEFYCDSDDDWEGDGDEEPALQQKDAPNEP